MLIMNRVTMSIETLCSPHTSMGEISYLVREAAARITSSLVYDRLTLLGSMSDYSKPATANIGINNMNAMVSNLMLFQTSETSFGDAFVGGNSDKERCRSGDSTRNVTRGVLRSDQEFTKYTKLLELERDFIKTSKLKKRIRYPKLY